MKPFTRSIGVAKSRTHFRLILIIMMTVLLSCEKDVVNSAEELKSYVMKPANNLTRKSILNGYEVSVSYKPADLLIYQEIGGEPTDHQKLFNIERKYQDNYYFVISVAKSSSAEVDIDQSRFRDLSTSLVQFLRITTSGKDTLKEDGVAVEETKLHTTATEIIFVVSKEKTKSQQWIQFNLNEFGLGLGNHEFKFHIRDLESVPKLKFELIS